MKENHSRLARPSGWIPSGCAAVRSWSGWARHGELLHVTADKHHVECQSGGSWHAANLQRHYSERHAATSDELQGQILFDKLRFCVQQTAFERQRLLMVDLWRRLTATAEWRTFISSLRWNKRLKPYKTVCVQKRLIRCWTVQHASTGPTAAFTSSPKKQEENVPELASRLAH